MLLAQQEIMTCTHADSACIYTLSEALHGLQGVVELVSDYVVCQKGGTLTSNQAALLRVFDVKMAAFRMYPVGCWLAEGVCKHGTLATWQHSGLQGQQMASHLMSASLSSQLLHAHTLCSCADERYRRFEQPETASPGPHQDMHASV